MIIQLLHKFRTKDSELFKYIDQLEMAFSSIEPEVQAFVPEKRRFARIRDEAEQLQWKFPIPEKRPPLFGLLVGVKDIFHVDGFPTKAGSQLPPYELSGDEAVIISSLRNLGALILGKTITTEFAYFAPGPTRNPHNLGHTPGGSSSGSAAAVASGLVPFALGTQTIGSIIRPASYCGVFGYKPTYGRISTEGVMPLAPSVDTVGFFTENADDAEFLCSLIINNWKSIRYINCKPVLGIPSGQYLDNANSEMRLFFMNQAERLRSIGYSILEIQAMPDFDQFYKHHNNLVAYETAKTHEYWYKKYSHLYHPKSIDLIEKGKEIDEVEYKNALISCSKLNTLFQSLQKQNGVDLWFSPPAQGVAPIGLESTGNPVMNLPWSHCGFPTINIPAGFNQDGLPMGLQISAARDDDESLINWALALSKDIRKLTQQ